jgi:hypothetical protein
MLREMTPYHPRWREFMVRLRTAVDARLADDGGNYLPPVEYINHTEGRLYAKVINAAILVVGDPKFRAQVIREREMRGRS